MAGEVEAFRKEAVRNKKNPLRERVESISLGGE
jgi:hypothetical protein